MWLAIGAAKMPRMVSAGGPILWVCFGFPPIVQCFFLPSAVSFIPFQGRARSTDWLLLPLLVFPLN